ncbi:MAG: methionine synthase [Dehalococcoidales bacterium]
MTNCQFGCLPTIIGTFPHKDPVRACELVTHYLRDIPAWPQLPKRTFLENMYAQYSEGFPGIVIKGDKIYVDRNQDLTKQLEKFYTDYLANDFSKYILSPEYAAGFHTFIGLDKLTSRAIKGHVTGPVSWGLTVTDETGKGIIYDETLGDVVPKFLRLKASWQEQVLNKINRNTIIFVDEPYMTAFGSIAMQLSREQVIAALEETFAGIKGIKGVHCCGNTDWSVLMQTSTNIVHFDAYKYPDSLAIYTKEVKKFLDNGNCIGWGIIPTDAESVNKESVASLKDRLESAMAPFTRKGIPLQTLIEQGLLLPACGLGPIGSEAAAERALQLLADLSAYIRSKYL